MSKAEQGAANIKTGDAMPGFKLPVHTGGERSLSEFKGTAALVLFFYPKANTSG